MKIEIEVDGFKCRAETDFESKVCNQAEQGVANAAVLKGLSDDVKAIAFKLIETKYGRKEER